VSQLPEKMKRTWWERLTAPYRLVLLNDETFEEVTSFRLTRMNVYVLASTIFVILVAITVSAIVYTPLKEYIPGYADVNMRRNVIELTVRSDSLEKVLAGNQRYLENIRRIITGDLPSTSLFDTSGAAPVYYDSINPALVSPEEQQLRSEVEEEERYRVTAGGGFTSQPASARSFLFFTPVKGYITEPFNARKQHYGIDIVAPQNEPVKAALDGIVVFSGWTVETGNVIALQHRSNLLSIYKHNSALLKEEGDPVKAGDVIAIIGNTGELTTGPHLHFEIWHNGLPLDPAQYLTLK
jgi:murein DD-endopeptidase MepM/ murein hydrolase activator NlpD